MHGETRNIFKILFENPCVNRSCWKFSHRLEEDIEMDFEDMLERGVLD
jgi:hypothetical protein